MTHFAYHVTNGEAEQITAEQAIAAEGGLVWIHLATNNSEAQTWLAQAAGLDDYLVDALTATETRPRCDAVGDGAFLNDRRIRVSKRETLNGALLATGFPFRQRVHLDAQLAMTRALLGKAEDLRRAGSAALDLAWTANARLDGYFEPGLKPWDMAAGCLLVREAGGRYCDFAGRDGLPVSGNILAGNHHIVAQMIETIAPTLTPELLKA